MWISWFCRQLAMTLTTMNIIGKKCGSHQFVLFLLLLLHFLAACLLVWYICSFVHGRLPYENLKPDPVLRSLLLNLPFRKVVSHVFFFFFFFSFTRRALSKNGLFFLSFLNGWNLQIFTNADKIHATKVLSRLGLEGCFEGIICFETLNPIHKNTASDDEDEIEFLQGSQKSSTTKPTKQEIFDIIAHFAQPNPTLTSLPKTPIVCKPSESAIEKALKIANINPHRTVRFPLHHDTPLFFLIPSN